jgi:ESS family glutamate:Na+ symporter
MNYLIEGRQIIILAILVLYFGFFLTQKITFLRKYSIPVSVTGGIIFSVLAAVLAASGIISLSFDLELRALMLLIFFATIGLNAKLSELSQGGKPLILLIISCGAFLILQNIVGISVAMTLGKDPLLGLFGGSISLAGGHGTAIAWGEAGASQGIAGAAEFGIACATLGLIMGGILGGPIAGNLIQKHKLTPTMPHRQASRKAVPAQNQELPRKHSVSVEDIIDTTFALAVCLALGDAVNRYLFDYEIRLPGFLTAMVAGAIISNTTTLSKMRLNKEGIDLIGGVALQLFMVMSLMSMNLLAIADSAVLLVAVMACQVLLALLFATQVVFRLLGRDYDAAIIVGGFFGLVLGATPVAMASMDAASKKQGVSSKALLVIPLVGAFFIDLINAATIQGFLKFLTLQ